MIDSLTPSTVSLHLILFTVAALPTAMIGYGSLWQGGSLVATMTSLYDEWGNKGQFRIGKPLWSGLR